MRKYGTLDFTLGFQIVWKGQYVNKTHNYNQLKQPISGTYAAFFQLKALKTTSVHT